jgi:hypothetical protein
MNRAAVFALLLAGCAQPPNYTCASGPARTYQLTGLTLPQKTTDFAIDLDGDGRLDNALGGILQALAQVGAKPQDGVDAAFGSGQQTTELQTVIVEGRGATVVLADQPAQEGVFCLDATASSSQPPATMAQPVELTVGLSFLDSVKVHLTAAQIDLHDAGGDTVTGELHGAIPHDELLPYIQQRFARFVTEQLSASPSEQLASLFDVGDGVGGSCVNADGTPGAPHDGVVSTCEIAANPLVKNLFANDLDLFDAQGAFGPDQDGVRDSLSFGVGFTAHVR